MTATEKFLFDFDFDRPAVNDEGVDELNEEDAINLEPEILLQRLAKKT